jgi:hypothetical protein
MATNIIPLSEQRAKARIRRGRQLFEDHADEIVFLENDIWAVPGTLTTHLVNVRLSRCDCADYEHRGALLCKHQVAASIANAKSRTCSCCSERVLGRFTTEVTEEDGLLSWFVGDVLCAECIRSGYWA